MPAKSGRRGTGHERCVLDAADGRLRELHFHWHSCLEHYDEPATFRMSLNAALQAARNITFAVQKQKAFLASAPEIYPQWQIAARGDSVLQWVLASRNRVVKEDDLDAESTLVARLITDYEDAANIVLSSLRPNSYAPTATSPGKEYRFNPSLSKRAVLRALGDKLPERILQKCSITLERRWLDPALPETELLGALSYAYTKYAELLVLLHRAARIDHQFNSAAPLHQFIAETSDDYFSRPHCMLTTREFRSTELDLEDDRLFVGMNSRRVNTSREALEQARQLLPMADFSPPAAPSSPSDYIEPILQTARSIVEAGMQHEWFIWFFRGATLAEVIGIVALTDADKRRYSQMVAETCAVAGFDGVLMVNEAWIAPADLAEDGYPILGRDHPDRVESVIVEVVSADGIRATAVSIYHRQDDGIVWDDPTASSVVIDKTTASNFLRPVIRVWDEWA